MAHVENFSFSINEINNSTNVSIKPQDDNFVTAITQSTLGLIGIFGNLCVLIVFLSNKSLRSRIINIYIINQVSLNPQTFKMDHENNISVTE